MLQEEIYLIILLLIFGGDDVCAVFDPTLAIQISNNFQKEFEKNMAKKIRILAKTFYRIFKNDIFSSEIQNLTKSYLGKSINSEILAVYYENEFFDRDKSVIVLTERSIVILTNSFGEIPFIFGEKDLKGSIAESGFKSASWTLVVPVKRIEGSKFSSSFAS